jgi:ketosteroid isomerase-like protein
MTDRSPRDTALAYMAAWNTMDAGACAACFDPDGVREGRILARATAGGARFPRFVGREAIRARIAGFMEAVPDLHVEVLRVGEGPADTAWLEWRLTATHRHDWGAWVARGERVDVPAVSVYTVRRGLITEEAEYIDPAVMMTPPQ